MKKSGEKILDQATGNDRAPSEDVVDASVSVFNGGDNILRSAATRSQTNEKVRRKEEHKHHVKIFHNAK